MSAFYTPAEIEAFAARQGCTVEEFKQRWIIVFNGACFIHGPHGYRAPIRHQLDIEIAIKKRLAPVPSSAQSKAGIDWEMAWGQSSKEKSISRIITEYGSVAERHVLSTSIEHSYYDAATETFFEHICPMRKLDPVYDAQVDQWLRLLGGDHPETLLDWVSTCTDLTRASCAIYLDAPKSCGKTMLANGLARCWGEMPTPFESAISTFNSAILNCPLIFADEQLPRGTTSGTIREFIGSVSRPIKRKNRDEGSMLGALRLIIAANGPDLLRFDKEDFHLEDIQAIAERILYFKCSPEAARYLEQLGGFQGTKDWVTGDRIAKHALWLAQTRQVKKTNRFLITGGVDVIHRSLATKGATRDRAVEWICRAMLEKWQTPNPGIRFGNGELFVNALFVQETWETLLKDQRIPSLVRIGQAFRPLAIGEKRLPIGPKAKDTQRRADFYNINPQFVYDNVAKFQMGTVDEFRALIERSVDDKGEGGAGGAIIPINGANGHSNGHVNGHARDLFGIEEDEIDLFSAENQFEKSLLDRLT